MKLQEIIEANMSLIYKIANEFYNVELDDLIQAGKIGVIKAYRNYKKDGNTKFSTYAYKYIYGEMYSFVNQNYQIKINRYLLKVKKLAEKTRYELAQKYGRIPNNNELATYLELDVNLINEATIANDPTISFDEVAEGSRSIYETISAPEDVSLDDKIDIYNSLDKLSNDERKIIKARFYKDMTQSEIAKELNMTQVMVSRYEKKGLAKMREYMMM